MLQLLINSDMPRNEVNYIMHLEAIALKISEDNRLKPWHISLYYTLFHLWNSTKFFNPLSVSRNELMRVSKIGSVNTYTKCLKELHEWGYIEYIPSHNPLVGSQINLYRFDKSTSKSRNKTRSKTDDKTEGTVVRPYINNNKPSKPLKLDSEKRNFSPPSIEQLKEFFLESESTGKEAENFFNYFESNGWLVGGKAKMKNWKAAARNWISRCSNFKKPEKKNYLDVNQDKDYSMPL